MKKLTSPLLATLCGLALILPFSTARAQTAMPHPFPHPHPPFPPFRPPLPRQQLLPVDLQLQAQKATIQIGDASARVTLKQTFVNPSGIESEGTFLWSVPPGAAISDLSVTLGGKKIAAEILPADKAREIYTGIVRQKRDPAILEFVGRDLVRAKIFPIFANAKVEVELSYSQTLTGNRFNLPLRVPGESTKNGADDVADSVDLTFTGSDVRAVFSPSHPVEVARSGEQTRVTGEFSSNDRDFSLLWTRGANAVDLQMLTYQSPTEKDGFFLLLAAPDARKNQTPVEAKDVTFVFDTSGSMNDNGKIEQARRALQTLLSNLGAQDRFNIVTFASDVKPFRDTLTPTTPANLDAARAFVSEIKAVGGTNIEAALDKATSQSDAKSTRPQQIVFLTDGLPTVGETNVETLLNDAKKANQNARMWTFGVGFDVNTRLLDGLASENGGDADYVLPKEDIETKVGALYQKIAYPVLTDTKLDFGGLETYDVYPRRLPDLFRGGQMTVMGRFKGAPKTVSLSGQIAGAPRDFSGNIGAGGDELPRLWATRKVGFLIEDARRAGRPIAGEVRDEITGLSTKYGVVTPLTAALITEDQTPGRVPILGDLPVGSVFRSAGGFGGASNANGPAAPVTKSVAGAVNMGRSTGEAAVATSQAQRQLRDGYAAPSARADTKVLGGKTFVLRDGVWTDVAFDATKFPAPKIIKFGSDAYFDLLNDAQIAQWLSAGEQVVWVSGGVAVRVEK